MKDEITEKTWPKHLVKSIDCRKKDLIIRITDWTKDKNEPAFDVEFYYKGVYDFTKSKSFTTKSSNTTKKHALILAKDFACKLIMESLR